MISRPLLILICGCTLAGPAAAGSLNAPAAPDAAGSAMYTLQDLYNRLNAGTAGVPRPGAFAEPAAGPGSTMHTLTEVMNRMPALDANGATTADVLSGKTFWGLTSGAWGKRTGAIPTRTVSNATTSQSAGYYNAFNLATVDSDLAAANIKSGVTIFGVAGTYPVAAVPKTGRTTSYGTRDDGALQKGVPLPSPRFTDNGNGTVTDNLTRLIWLKNAGCLAGGNWAGALTAANTLNTGECGLTDGSAQGDWRLPNVRELFSLIDFGRFQPALPLGHPFLNVSWTNYWSSTQAPPTAGFAWYVSLSDGAVYPAGTGVDYPMWPVRGGQ